MSFDTTAERCNLQPLRTPAVHVLRARTYRKLGSWGEQLTAAVETSTVKSEPDDLTIDAPHDEAVWPSAMKLLAAILLSSTALMACSSGQPEPLTASSAGDPGYAARYPDELTFQRERFALGEQSARNNLEAMPEFPDEVPEADPEVVLGVVEAADEAGRSNAYAQRFAQSEHVARFFVEEKDKLGQQVGGSVRYAAKQKGASEEVVSAAGGAAVHGMDKAVNKQLEERMRAHNQAHDLIEQHAESLGPANTEKLEKQADEISRTSYLVHVGLVELRRRLQEQVAEGSEVRSTLDRSIEGLRAISEDTSRKEKERAWAQGRLEAAEAARQRLDGELEEAQRAAADMEARTKQLQEDYQKAMESLKRKIEQRLQ